MVQLRFRLHLPLAILCNGHFFHGRDAVARELLVDDIGLGELQWMRHDHGPPRGRKHRRKCSGEIPLSAAGRYVRFARDAWRPAKTGSPTALPRVRGSLVSDRWLKNLGSFQGKKISSWIIRRLAPKRAPALCGCKKHGIDTYGDHTATCTAHSGATKAHDWAVGVLGPLFRSAGHTVRTQHQVTAIAGHRHGDVEIREYLLDAAGSQSLVFDLSITHDRFGSSTHVQQNRTSATRRI